ncbi:MAG: SDR family oxidoreductase [Anaerolineae bacterium]|jgi:3-oxoacyl-[acyl-carrier protein] reductase/pteridine reductase|nr:SDR family oxidoreductase [Anaerolineae bacterium]
MNPAGKTALITGGAVRVGRAITLALAQAGANVVINYHSSAAAADETLAAARAAGVQALALPADVADPAQVQALVAQAAAQFGGVDILVNSASLYLATPFPTDDLAGWQRVTRIQIDGAFYCANAVAPGMLARGEGVIVNIVDMSAWLPAPHYTAHSVSKAALLALTRQLAVELAPAVRVNAVAPGPVLPPPGFTPEQLAAAADVTLLKKWGRAEDVAEAVLFLIRAGYITGEYITVDGGERYGFRRQSPEGV